MGNLQASVKKPNNNADSADRPICVGSRVRIHGLNGGQDLNGKVGNVVKCPSPGEPLGRYTVELAPNVQKSIKFVNISLNLSDPETTASSASANTLGMKGKMVDSPGNSNKPKTREERVQEAQEQQRKIKEENKRCRQDLGDTDIKSSQFKTGSRVRVGGLNGSTQLNGQLAVIFDFDKSTAKYLVEFENGQGRRLLQGSRLTDMGVATGALAAKARMYAQMKMKK